MEGLFAPNRRICSSLLALDVRCYGTLPAARFGGPWRGWPRVPSPLRRSSSACPASSAEPLWPCAGGTSSQHSRYKKGSKVEHGRKRDAKKDTRANLY